MFTNTSPTLSFGEKSNPTIWAILLSPKFKTKSSLKLRLELISSKMYFKPTESDGEYTDNSNSVIYNWVVSPRYIW